MNTGCFSDPMAEEDRQSDRREKERERETGEGGIL